MPHHKTQLGLFNLLMSGHKPDILLAAPPVTLPVRSSQINIKPPTPRVYHPAIIANRFDIPYHVVEHNSAETARLVEVNNLDLGIILGARILKPIAFEPFNKGVLNLHPGLLPENGGMDSVKWAVVLDIPQGVTAHLIDSKIDRGTMVLREEVMLVPEDTPITLGSKIQSLEQKLMIESIEFLEENPTLIPIHNEGITTSYFPQSRDNEFLRKFLQYVKRYANARVDW